MEMAEERRENDKNVEETKREAEALERKVSLDTDFFFIVLYSSSTRGSSAYLESCGRCYFSSLLLFWN